MFDTVVFCGGGNHCFWQAGFWEAVVAETGCMPKRVLAVSAGAYVACRLFGGRMRDLLVRNFDATAALGIQRAFEQGQDDGLAFVRQICAGL